MRTFIEALIGVVVAILCVCGIAFIALVIYYYPVIDRLYLNTCNYYPHAFKDC